MRALAVLLACLLSAAAGADKVDPKATALLEAMTQAYRSLRSIDQTTTYSTNGPVSRLKQSHLLLQKPNRLLMEISEEAPDRPGITTRRYQCDGKDLYTWNQLQNYFTQEKAPRDFAGMKLLAANLEMAAIVGLEPFTQLAKDAQGGKLEQAADVDSEPCDVVLLDLGNDIRTLETRLYIARSDHLLRKFRVDSRYIVHEDKQALPQDEPQPNYTPPAIRFEYQNRVTANTQISPQMFTWMAPPGALKYQANLLGSPSGKRQPPPYTILGEPVDLSNPTDPLDLSKATKKVHAKDLVDRANKQRKQ